jgi:hypothetical protein
MKNKSIYTLLILSLFAFPWFLSLAAQPLSVNLKNAQIAISAHIPSPQRETILRMLQEEIQTRTGVFLRVAQSDAFTPNKPVIAIAKQDDVYLAGLELPKTVATTNLQAEGYMVFSEMHGPIPVIWIIVNDSRGALFGAGWLLRHLQMEKNQISLALPVAFQTAPSFPIRGHQLGYRNTANTYDAWTPEQYEQYIRELIIFGTNAVEIIPIIDQEDATLSVHMKVPPLEMNRHISKICKDYGIDLWAWTPVTIDLKDLEKKNEVLDKHEAFYRETPQIDHIFFPGGDPGHNHPREVLPFLQELHRRLTSYHPKAGMWISLQGFSVEQVDYFYNYLDTHSPDWLRGVVSGPSSPPLAETRFRLPSKYLHRHYPDITHTVRCDFPTLNWDQAFALTQGREPINPQPFYYAQIHQKYAPFTDGFVAYSDGSTDDVNKVVWSMRGWDMNIDVNHIIESYSRFFFGSMLAKDAAIGIFALEKNWDGPLAANGGVETTLSFWKKLERENQHLNRTNWRWQMLLVRSFYDAYIRRRLLYEQSLEKSAYSLLLQDADIPGLERLQLALDKINEADRYPVSSDLRKRIEEVFEDLFQSIGLQSSVPKYQARGYERGAMLDFVDYPLNNRWWLADQAEFIKTLESEVARLEILKRIATWENPGSGSYYDDISNISKGPRVTTVSEDATDVAWWENGFSRERLSTQLFQKSPVIQYENLDPSGRYMIRVFGSGDALLRVNGHRLSPITYTRDPQSFKEWIVPLEISRTGNIEVTFDIPEETHLNWRQHSKISDIWLLKK